MRRIERTAYRDSFDVLSEAERGAVKPDSRPPKHWPRGQFAACWNAARKGDLEARSRLLEHLREPAVRMARRFGRRNTDADPGELAGLADVALIEVIDRELKRS